MPFRVFIAVLSLSVAALSAAPALAAPKQGKEYAMDIAPQMEWAGVTDGAYTIKLTNNTGTQQIGSANVTVPSAITVVARPADVGGSGNQLELRNLAIPPDQSTTVTVGLRMPCVAGSYDWGVTARQSNDFSGLPGNALGPVSGNRTTTVQGSCALRFVDEPASAEKLTQIRADEFQPASTHLITVEALDGSPTPQRLTWFTGTVDLRLVQSGPGTLSPNPASSAAVAGLASFSNLSIDKSGNYNLRATTAAGGFTADDSAPFQVVDDAAGCSASSCKAQVPGKQTTSTLTGSGITGTGFALLSLNLGPAPTCAGYTPPTNEWYEFQLSRSVTGDVTIDAFYYKAVTKTISGQIEICFAAPKFFTAKGDVAQPFDYDGDPLTGKEGFSGLLPNCVSGVSTPCVVRRANGSTGTTVTISKPAAWGDPRYR